MGLHLEKDPDFRIPEGGLTIVSENVTPLCQDSYQHKAFFGDVNVEGLRALTPHKIYVADLEAVEGPDVLAAASPAGWRYILVAGDEAVATAELAMDKGNQNVRFSRVAQGPCAKATIRELEGIAPQVADDEYELRFLRIRDLRFFGLWLHCYDHFEKDFVICLPPAPPGMEDGQRLTHEELINKIKAAAENIRTRFLRRP
jgi:hypothetical protein